MSFYDGSFALSNMDSPILDGGENLKVVVESLQKSPSCFDTSWERLSDFFNRNSLVVLIFSAITFSYTYPPLGAVYLNPNITASWVAVLIIFFVSGLGMRTEEFSKSIKRIRFNLFVQTYNFFVVSIFVYMASRLMVTAELIPQSLADGLVICSCLPQAINTVIVLTKSAGGDEAASIFNSAFSNLSGIILSPLLIFCYLGVSSHVDMGEVFVKLFLKVAIPITIGQLLHNLVVAAKTWALDNKLTLKKTQESCMAFIVFTVFSKLWYNGSGTSALDVVVMGALQCCVQVILMAWAWLSLRLLFPEEPKLQAAGIFNCTCKTMAMGIPLINTLYEDDPNLVFYTLPLLIWYPLTIILGIFIAPNISMYVKRQEQRLLSESFDNSDPQNDAEEGYVEMEPVANLPRIT
mmetsp:Transcript_8098/g.16968  ORF Transcript_8098/g.16968 Transcript_8098/m.16968 type:complete len:407 (+) Transcript_8098:34-1254(+)